LEDIMPKLARLSASAQPDEIHSVLVRDGALILTDAAPLSLIQQFRDETEPYMLATQPGRDSFTGFRTTRTGALASRSAAFRQLMMRAEILAQCKALLGPNCDTFQLHLGQIIRIMPEQEAQPIHRDRWAWGTYLKGVEPQVNTIWAISPFSRENGATQVVPGSVDWPDDRVATPEEITWAEMDPGSVLLYTGSVFHGGGANQSPNDRIGLNLTYTLGWLRQEENQYLSCPPDIAKHFTPEEQAMIGYSMGGYALGYYSPPLPAGTGPEVVPPEHALNGLADGSRLGTVAMQDAVKSQIASGT
jgi:ectoine hydroxylase-related dioxygenase (phytanoyl-CoA dioxygenase family)